MRKRTIKRKIIEFLWEKISKGEYSYTKEGLEKLKTDLTEFLEILLLREIVVEIPIDKNLVPKIFIKYKTKPKFIIHDFESLLSD